MRLATFRSLLRLAGLAPLLARPAAAQDLVPTGITGPAAAFLGDTLNLIVSFKNAGTVGVGAPWPVAIYLSSDTAITRGDSLLALAPVMSPLAAGAGGSITVRAPLPSTYATGTWYLGAILNLPVGTAETSSANNTIRFGALRVDPRIDLIATATVTGSMVPVGQKLAVGATVQNAGLSPVGSGWLLSWYLSTDTLWSIGDSLLGSVAGVSLAAGASAALSGSFTVTAAPGRYAVLARADAGGTVVETNEGNNSRPSSAWVGVTAPDLVLSAVQLNAATVTAGQNLPVSATVQNASQVAAGSGWTLNWYLSSDTVWSAGDSLLGTSGGVALAAGASGTITASLPVRALAGGYFVLARADAGGSLAEMSETNNTRASATQVVVTVLPDLSATVLLSGSGFPGTTQPLMYVGSAKRDSVRVDVTVSNAGSVGVAAGWMVAISQGLNGVTTLLKRVPFGGSIAGGGARSTMTVWVQPIVAPADLGPSALLTLPISVRLDDGNAVSESDESNNTTQANLEVRLGPDLAPQSLTPSGALVEGGAAGASVVVASVAGYHAIPTGWTVDLWVVPLGSTGFARRIGSSPPVTSLLFPGTPLTVQVGGTMPALAYGQYGLRAVADPLEKIPEDYNGPAGEANNSFTTGVLLSVPGPDLVVSSIVVGKWDASLDSVAVTYTFRNMGTRSALPSSASSTIHYSTCASSDGVTPNPSCGGGVIAASNLPAGGTTSVTERFWVPPGESFYLITTVDSGREVFEENEQNNSLASSKKVSRS